MTDAIEKLEALERVVWEVDALAVIFCQDEIFDSANKFGHALSDNSKYFSVTTVEALELARRYISDPDGFLSREDDSPPSIPRIDVDSFVTSTATEGNHDKVASEGIQLRMSLPPGYPIYACAEATVLSAPKNFFRVHRDALTARLRQRANELRGSEAMMELINDCRDALMERNSRTNTDDLNGCMDLYCEREKDTKPEPIGRRWIWVHHITNTDRLKQIVSEARSFDLGGYVKGGYPGVVIIEGRTSACDEFVGWIKGNKSRPGGFGRNWGHHVRGEVTVEERKLPVQFQELEDDMGQLGALCKQFGVENEFREFILQHSK